jgi:pyruvate kinase
MATVEELVDRAELEVTERGFAVVGDHMVLTAAIPIGSGVTTNMLRIKQLS